MAEPEGEEYAELPAFFEVAQREAVVIPDYVSEVAEDDEFFVEDEPEETGEAQAAEDTAEIEELLERCHISDKVKDVSTGVDKNDILPKYVNKNSGIISTYTGNDELKEVVHNKRRVQMLRDLKNEWDEKCTKASDAKQTLAYEQQRLRAMEMDTRRTSEEIFVQADEVEKSWRRLTDAEKIRDSSELKLHQLIEQATTAERAMLRKEYELSIIATRRQADEVARGDREIEKVWEKDWQNLEEKAAQKADREHKEAEAIKHRKKNNKEMLTPALIDKADKDALAKEVRDAKWDFRTKALLQLKSNIKDINSKIQSENERKAKKKLQEDLEKKEREMKLLEQGLNPYEVFRREEVEEKLAKKKVEGAAMQAMRTEKLLQRLIVEEQDIRAKEAAARKQKEFQVAYQREQAGQSKSVKISNYIKKVTIDKVEILDPTGNAMRIDPSKVTVQKTGGFGLGQAPPEELALVQQKLAWNKARCDAWDREEARKRDDGIDFGGEEKEEEEEKEPLPDGKLWLPKRTVLEEKMLEAAKIQQREGICSVQKCWGKIFEGTAFLSKPSIIEFPDFVANEKYKQIVEVTNVSLTFNQFKLLPMNDVVKDFFEIGFDPPGRMSAGVSCKITLRFLPKLYMDIWTTFPILAKTGRIDFPVRCLTKKTILDIEPKKEQKYIKGSEGECLLDPDERKKVSKSQRKKKGPPDPTVPPELRDEEYWDDPSTNLFIDFGAVVFGEWSTRQLTIKNTGALEANYYIREATLADEPEPPIAARKELRASRMKDREAQKEILKTVNANDYAMASPEILRETIDRIGQTGALQLTQSPDIAAKGGKGNIEGEDREPGEGEQGADVIADGNQSTLKSISSSNALVASVIPGGGTDATTSYASSLPSMLQYKEKGEFVANGGTSKIVFTFTPRHLGEYACKLVMEVDNGAPGDARFKKSYYVKMIGRCVDVPIYVEREIYNMHTMIYEHTFREMILLRNRSAVTMKIKVDKPQMNDPRLLPGEIQINPITAYVQGNNGGQEIQFKMNLQRDFLIRNPQYKRDERKYGPNAYKIPVKIVGSDQILPAWCCIVGNLTQNDITFCPERLDFGNCFVNSAVYQKILVTNHSKHPQSFCYTQLPPHLSVQNMAQDAVEDEEKFHIDSARSATIDTGGNGFLGSLLPEETLPLCVRYEPQSATEMKTRINFRVQTGNLCSREFFLECTGQGKMVHIEQSKTMMQMPCIPVQSTVVESFQVKNRSDKLYELSVACPPVPLANLYICPICTELAPGKETRVQIQFKPTKEYERLLIDCEDDMESHTINSRRKGGTEAVPEAEPQAAEAEGEEGAAGEDGDAQKEDEEEEKDESPSRKVAGTERFLTMKKSEIIGEINAAGGRRWEHYRDNDLGLVGLDPRNTKQKKTQKLQEIESQHCVWKIPILIKPVKIENEKRVPISDEKCQQSWVYVRTTVVPPVLVPMPDRFDFGEVTVYQRKLLHLTLRSRVDEIQHVHLTSPLPESSCFTVLNSTYSRTVTKKKPFQICIEFCPQEAQHYSTVLKLHTALTRIQVPIKGKGVCPKLKVPDVLIHFDACVHGTKSFITKEVKLCNSSRYLLRYALKSIVTSYTQNQQGIQAFSFVPRTGQIEGKETDDSNDTCSTLQVTFRPHRPFEIYREKVYVDVPNQEYPTFLYFYAHCFEYQMYVIYDLHILPFESNVLTKSQYTDGTTTARQSETESTNPEDVKMYESAQRTDLYLTFEDSDGSDPETQDVRYIMIGCAVAPETCGTPAAGGAGGNFDITIADPKYFGVATPKDAVAAGSVKRIAFKYLRPEQAPLAVAGLDLDLLKGVGQWTTTTAKIVLSGGFVPRGAPATQEITVHLKAYLRQI